MNLVFSKKCNNLEKKILDDKPQNPGSLDRYWINIIKIIYKIKPSSKMGIEPRCTWSFSRRTPRWSSRWTSRCSSSKRSWNLLSHEICKWFQKTEIPKDFTFGWCNQKSQKVNYIFGDLIHDSNWFSEAWNEHWSSFCADDVQVSQNDGHTFSFDCWNWLLLLVARHFSFYK